MRPQLNPLIAVVFVLMTGCGNARDPYTPLGPRSACVDGFVNETILPTGHPDDLPHVGEWLPNGGTTLWDLWHAAQRDLSTNPIAYLDRHTIPPLPQAATEQPNCQRVVSVPDTLPGGGFTCDGTPAAGCCVNGTVFIANSKAFCSVWETENAILARYGLVAGR